MIGAIIDFWNFLPSFTRIQIICMTVVAGLANYDIQDNYYFAIWPPSTFNWKEAHKVILSSQYNGPFSFFLLFQLYFVALLSGRLERLVYHVKAFGLNAPVDGYADYVWMLGTFFFTCNFFESIIVWKDYYYISSISFNMCIFYICCRFNYEENITCLVFFDIKGKYLPILISLVNYYNSRNVFSIILGVIIGELYYLLRIKTQEYEKWKFQGRQLKTPSIFVNVVNWTIDKKNYILWKLWYKDWDHFAFQRRGQRVG